MIVEARRWSGRTSSVITKEVLADGRDGRNGGRARSGSRQDARSRLPPRRCRSPPRAEGCRQRMRAAHSNSPRDQCMCRRPVARKHRDDGRRDGCRHDDRRSDGGLLAQQVAPEAAWACSSGDGTTPANCATKNTATSSFVARAFVRNHCMRALACSFERKGLWAVAPQASIPWPCALRGKFRK